MPDQQTINPQLETRHEQYRATLRVITEEIQKQKLVMIAEYRATIQNIAIISGAVASFSLTVLQTQINRVVFLLIFGACVLLLNALFIFAYILWRQSISVKKTVAMEEDFFAPLSKMRDHYIDLKNGKITEQQYLEFEKTVIHGKLKSKVQVPLERQTTDNWEILFIVLFAVGILSIIGSLLLPYLKNIQIQIKPVTITMTKDKISALVSLATTFVILVASFFQWWSITYDGAMKTKGWIKAIFCILIIATLVAAYFLI